MGLVRIRQDLVEFLRPGGWRLRARRRSVGKRLRSAGRGRPPVSLRSRLRESCEVLRATAHASSEHAGQFCHLPILRNLLAEIARTQEAVDIISAALKSCRLAAERAQGEGLELIKREEALLLSQAGRLDESFSALQSIRDVAAPAPRYDRPEYLPHTPQRLQRLADIVDSRDVFVLLQGPSLATFAARLHEFAGFEFAIATLNSFPPVEQELRRINRHADILLFTQPGSIRAWHPELMKFLARSPPNLVVASHYVLSGLSEFGLSEKEFVARHDKRLLRVHSDGPPLPSRPLHFENGPSVSWLIPLLLFARPRRIF